ncbi:fumarate reductase (CoM/CoB) subunit TfrB [Methanobrevibacter curvatus]|uniref:Lactate utilization protein A n=1 Tax=Methanobrevibacter curvatus TaxID=49547 RepID=A0A162FMB0_9EURY|nr:fumarate reductase (CoM/CoB) subunit TfrB [Methanobrevibacter curvatus]KZX12150.1 lactate utilization protein A [Methanobrevibacter curvatus]
MIEIQVLRSNFNKNEDSDNKSYLETFKIQKTEQMKVLDALNYINEHYDANIAFRSSCRAGQCGSCALKINDQVDLACKREIEDGDIISPLDFKVIKDLIVDKSDIEENTKLMHLFLERNGEYKNIKLKKLKSENIKSEDIKSKNHKSLNSDEDSSQFSSICECELIDNSKSIDTKKVRTCIECYSCLSACPVIKKTSEFLGPYYIRYISKFDFDPRDVGDRTKESIDYGLYCCTSCGECGEVCPKNINSFSDAIEKLRALAYQENLGPLQPHKDLARKIVETGHSVDKLNDGFIETYNKIIFDDNSNISDDKNNNFDSKKNNSNLNNTNPDYDLLNSNINLKNPKKPKIAIFTGCMVDYRLQNLGFALIDVLKANGFEADVPESQTCCGSPLLRTGQRDLVAPLVEKNRETFKDYDLILTICAGCGATLKNDYPDFDLRLNVMDISEFLVDSLNTNKMKDLNLKVTYHDPCHLSRGQSITEEPRKILKNIKGVEFIEMAKPNQCCGSGGGVRAGKPEIAASLVDDKVQMIEDISVDAVISICPFCQFHIQDALKNHGLDIKVMNILELLQMAYK